MRLKLLLLVLIVCTVNAFSQNVGDYRSRVAGPVNWNLATSWEYYNGTTWVNASTPTNYGYPGQTAGTYNVEIRSGHTISNPNTPNAFGTLTINGTLRLTGNNATHNLFSSEVIVIPGTGTPGVNYGFIDFVDNCTLALPVNSSISIFAGGLSTVNPCSASKIIKIGNVNFATCNGGGQGDPIDFPTLIQGGGTINANIAIQPYQCKDTSVTLNGSKTGSEVNGNIISYLWEVTQPNGVVLNPAPTGNEIPVNLALDGDYTIKLTYTATYTTTGAIISNTETVVIKNSMTTWNGANWVKWNGTAWISALLPDTATKVTIAGNYNTTTHGSFSACSLVINPGATVTIAPDTYIETEYNVTNNGTLNIENRGSLVQKDNTATFTGTNNTVTRISRPMKKLDYVYWGSPVETPTTLTAAPISTYYDLFYRWNLSGNATGNWAGITQSPAVGNGFIARVRASLFPAGSTATTTATTQFVFNGKLNSGPVSVYANVFAGGNVNVNSGNSILLANPYPSAINATTLLTSNTHIDKLLFWTSSTVYTGSGQYQVADYATFNLTGGTGLGISPTSMGVTTDLTPQGYITSGQGFFAQVTTPSNIVFNNNMRVGLSNTQFFRSAEPETFNGGTTEFERHRLWINFSNGTNAHRQLLVGYLDGATNGYDNRFDAISSTTNQIDIYTILEDTKELTIQGRALPFNNTDIIPLGYRVTNAGNYTISLSDMDGLFIDYNDIFLKDNVTNTYHNLKNGSFTFNTQTGIFNDRFEIHFVEESTLGINPIGSAKNLLIYGANGALNVKGFETNIQSIEVFDLVGKLLFAVNDVNTLDYASPTINTASPILIARVTDINNQVTTKKVILK